MKGMRQHVRSLENTERRMGCTRRRIAERIVDVERTVAVVAPAAVSLHRLAVRPVSDRTSTPLVTVCSASLRAFLGSASCRAGSRNVRCFVVFSSALRCNFPPKA